MLQTNSHFPAGHRHHHSRFTATRMIVFSFFAVIMCGSGLLMLPISTVGGISYVDALFTATSATCVTGLIVHDTATTFTLFGQCVILLLIQIGGLGIITITSFFGLVLGKKMGLKSRKLTSESINLNATDNVGRFLKVVGSMAFLTELVGALLLSSVLVPKYGAKGIFLSVFTSISAFCNAGFDLFGFIAPYTSLTTFYDTPLVLITVMLLIILGGLGVIVWTDLCFYTKERHLSFHTKIVLTMTAILIVLGALCIAVLEWDAPTTAGYSSAQKVLGAFFQSVTCRTAGFNSMDITTLNPVTKAVMTILMFIGAAPGGTGGGIKITTFSVLVFTVLSVIRGREDAVIYGRQIGKSTVYKAFAITTLGLLIVSTASVVVFFTCAPSPLLSEGNVIFEITSAFATVGLSTGITALLSTLGKVVTSFVMFIGRVGPISLAISITAAASYSRHEILPEGRVMVG